MLSTYHQKLVKILILLFLAIRHLRTPTRLRIVEHNLNSCESLIIGNIQESLFSPNYFKRCLSYPTTDILPLYSLIHLSQKCFLGRHSSCLYRRTTWLFINKLAFIVSVIGCISYKHSKHYKIKWNLQSNTTKQEKNKIFAWYQLDDGVFAKLET